MLAKVWARRKIEDLTEQMTVAGDPLEEEITELALQYRLASAFTSFVAVDENEQARLSASPHPPRRVRVPVPMPEGVSYEGVFGFAGDRLRKKGEEQKITGLARMQSGMDLHVAAMPAPAEALRSLAYIGSANAPPPPKALRVGRRAVASGVPAGPAPPPAPPTTTLPAAYLMAEPEAARMGADVGRRQDAKKALADAATLSAAKDWAGARRALQRAWLFEQAFFAASPWNDDGTRAAIAAEWQSLEAAHAAARAAAQPRLATKLDFVVRNEDLESALGSVARAAGLTVRIAPGSLDSAAQLQTRETLRVAYLDLRRATAAQAFGWLLGPFGLEWDYAGGAVAVRSLDPEVAKLLPARAAPQAGDVRTAGLARAQAALEAHSWALLAAALAGEVDDEAVSELREAWRAPGLAEALEPGTSLTLGARSAWAIALARRVRPADPALSALAQEAYAVLGQARARRPPPAFMAKAEAEVYLALLQQESGVPDAIRANAPTAQSILQIAPDGLRPVAAALLASGKLDPIAAAFEARTLRGDDAVVLAAWALRQGDPSAWSRFRASKSSWLSAAGASGGALRVVNRLEASRIAAPSPARRVDAAPEAGPPRLTFAAAGAGVGLALAGLVLRRRRRDQAAI